MGKSILKDLRSRELGRRPLKLHGLPQSFLTKHDSNNGDVLSLLASVSRLLRKRGKLESNADLAAFSTPIDSLVETLGVHGSRPEEPAAKARASFVRLGGPTLVAAILQARGLAPVADAEAQIAANACASSANASEKAAAVAGTSAGGSGAPGATAAADVVAMQESADSAAKIAVASAVGVAERASAAALESPPLPPSPSESNGGAGRSNRMNSRTSSGPRAQRTTETNLEAGNMILALLTEVVLGSDEAALALASWPSLIARLFALMTTPRLLDGAVSLAQELLSSGPDMFNLADVPNLSGIVARLPPRAFSLFSRTLAALLSKPEPPFNALAQPGLSPSLPPPECLAPNLCAACANRAVLVDIPGLLAKLVLLLRSKCPPKRLWPAMHYYLPSGNVIAADQGDDDWLSFAKRGQVPVLDHDGDRRSLAAAAARTSIDNFDYRSAAAGAGGGAATGGAAVDDDEYSVPQQQQQQQQQRSVIANRRQQQQHLSPLLRRSPLAVAVSSTRAAAAAGMRRRALGNGGLRPGMPVSLSANDSGAADGGNGTGNGGGGGGNNGGRGGAGVLFNGLGAIVRDLRAGFGGDRLIVLPAEQLPPGLEGDPFPHQEDLRVVKLAAFEGELWKTLEADLLFVVGTLLSNKAREKAQALLVKAGFVELLDELFERLDWRPPVKPASNARSTSSRNNQNDGDGGGGGPGGGGNGGNNGGHANTNTAANAAGAPTLPLSEALQSDSDIDSDDEIMPDRSDGGSGVRSGAGNRNAETDGSGGGYTSVNPPLALEDLLRPGHLEAMLNEDRRVNNTGGVDVGPNELDSARAQIAAVATQLALHSMSIGDGASGGGGDIDLFPPRNGAAKSRNNNDNNNNNNDASGDSDDDDESYIGPRPAPSSSSSGGGGGDEGAFSTARAWAARFMGRSSEATPTSSSASSASSGSSSGTSSTGAKNAIGGLALERSDSEEEEDDFGDSSDSEGSMNGAEDGAGEGGEGDDQDPAMHGEGCSCCAAACLQMSLLRTVAAFSEKTSGDAMHHRLLLSPLERRATTAETGPVPPAFYSSLQAADEGQLVVQDGWVVAPLHSRRRLSKKKKKMVEEIETVVASGGSGGGGDGSSSDDDGDNDDDVDDVDKHGAYGSEEGSYSDSEMEDSGVSGGGGRPPCSCCKDPSDVGDGTVCQPCEHYNPISSSEEGEEVEEGSKQHRRRRSAAQAAERLEAKTKAKEAKNKAAAERRAYQAYTSQALDAAGARMEVGLVRRVADLLVTQSPSSPYYFECASTLHKWLQGARPSEQDLLLRGTPGLLHWTLRELLNTAPPPPPPPSQSSLSSSPATRSGDAATAANLDAQDRSSGGEINANGEIKGEEEELFEEWSSNSNRSAQLLRSQNSNKKKKRKPLVPMDDSQRVLCDLLGELLKFNGSALTVLDHALGCPNIVQQVDQHLPARAQTSIASFRSITCASATTATATADGCSKSNSRANAPTPPPMVQHRSKRDKHDDCPLSPSLLPLSVGSGSAMPPLLSESIAGAAAAAGAGDTGRGISGLLATAEVAAAPKQASSPAAVSAPKQASSPLDLQTEASRKRFEALGRLVLAQPVNSAVLIQCLELTLGAAHKPLRLRVRVQPNQAEEARGGAEAGAAAEAASASAAEIQAANHRATAACDPDGYLSSGGDGVGAGISGVGITGAARDENGDLMMNEARPGEKWASTHEVLSLVAASVPPKRWRAKAVKRAAVVAAAAAVADKKATKGAGARGGTRQAGIGSVSSGGADGGVGSGGGSASATSPPHTTEGEAPTPAMPPGRGSDGRGVGGSPKTLAPVQLEALQMAAVRAAAAAGCEDTSSASSSDGSYTSGNSQGGGGGVVAFWSVLRPYVAVALFRALSAIPAASEAIRTTDKEEVRDKDDTSTTTTTAGGGGGASGGGAAAEADAATPAGKATTTAAAKPALPFSPDLCVVNATCVMLAEAVHAHEKERGGAGEKEGAEAEEDAERAPQAFLSDSWAPDSDLARILAALQEDTSARLAMKEKSQALKQVDTATSAAATAAASALDAPRASSKSNDIDNEGAVPCSDGSIASERTAAAPIPPPTTTAPSPPPTPPTTTTTATTITATAPATATASATSSNNQLPFRTGLRRALRHWRAYYEHQTYERRFVEFQTGMPFRVWRGGVKAIEQRVLPHLPDEI